MSLSDLEEEVAKLTLPELLELLPVIADAIEIRAMELVQEGDNNG